MRANGRSSSRSDPSREPLVSACLIVRDEARFLADCLRSLAGVADDVVVVDTGSTDGTAEIARRAGARVAPFAWCDDFAAARNAALDLARGRWVLQIDADERLVGPGGAAVDPEVLRGWLAAPPPGCGHFAALGMHLESDLGGGQVHRTTVPRLFRRRLGWRYRNRIHETFFPRGWREPWYLLPSVEIRHAGYAAEVERTRAKGARNLRLCALAVAENPADFDMHYHYGFELARAGRETEAAAHLRRAWELAPDWTVGSPLWWMIVVRAAEVLCHVGCAEEVLARLGPVLEAFPRAPYVSFLRGEALRNLRRPTEAFAAYRRGIELPPAGLAWEPPNTRSACWNGIGLVCEAVGRPDQAVEAYRQSLALGPTPCATARLRALAVGSCGHGRDADVPNDAGPA